jgi:hypothetical protein
MSIHISEFDSCAQTRLIGTFIARFALKRWYLTTSLVKSTDEEFICTLKNSPKNDVGTHRPSAKENIRNSLHALIGTASRAPMIENGVFERELERLGGNTPAGDEKPCLLRTIIWCMVVVTILVLEIVLRAVLGILVGPSTSTPQPSVTELPDGSTPTPTLNGTGTNSPKPRINTNPKSFSIAGCSAINCLKYLVTSEIY